MRLLVTGAGGQLGHDVVAAATAAGDDVVGVDRAALDVTDRDAVLGAITTLRPDAVVNGAAWTAVDACEGDPSGPSPANALAVRWIAEGCDRVGAHLVHVSTDYVFDGDARPAVPRVGRRRTRCRCTARRSSPASARRWRSGPRRPSCARRGCAASTVPTWSARSCAWRRQRRRQRRQRWRSSTTSAGHPTFTADLAPLLRRLARRPPLGRVPRHEPGRGVVVRVRRRGAGGAAGGDPAMVRPIATAELDPPRPAPRPANSVLDNAVLAAAGVPLLDDFRAPCAPSSPPCPDPTRSREKDFHKQNRAFLHDFAPQNREHRVARFWARIRAFLHENACGNLRPSGWGGSGDGDAEEVANGLDADQFDVVAARRRPLLAAEPVAQQVGSLAAAHHPLGAVRLVPVAPRDPERARVVGERRRRRLGGTESWRTRGAAARRASPCRSRGRARSG